MVGGGSRSRRRPVSGPQRHARVGHGEAVAAWDRASSLYCPARGRRAHRDRYRLLHQRAGRHRYRIQGREGRHGRPAGLRRHRVLRGPARRPSPAHPARRPRVTGGRERAPDLGSQGPGAGHHPDHLPGEGCGGPHRGDSRGRGREHRQGAARPGLGGGRLPQRREQRRAPRRRESQGVSGRLRCGGAGTGLERRQRVAGSDRRQPPR